MGYRYRNFGALAKGAGAAKLIVSKELESTAWNSNGSSKRYKRFWSQGQSWKAFEVAIAKGGTWKIIQLLERHKTTLVTAMKLRPNV